MGPVLRTLRAFVVDLQQLLEVVSEGVVIFAPDGRVLAFNQAAAALSGVPGPHATWAEALRGARFVDERGVTLPPDELPHARVLRTRTPVSRQRCFLKRADGQLRELAVSAVPFFDEAGAVERVVATYADLTSEVRLFTELRVFEQFFETASDFLLVVTPALTVRDANPSVLRTLGLTLDALRGRPFLSLLGGLDEPTRARLQSGTTIDFTATLTGTERVVTWHVVQSERTVGDVGFFVRGQDVTERARELDDLRRSRTTLAEAFELADLAVLERDHLTGRGIATPRLRALLQLPPEHPAEIQLEDFVLPEDRAVLRAQREHEEPVALRLTTAHTEVREVRAWLRRERDHELLVIQDITEQSLLQAQLRLTERLSSLGTMAAGVAHEINNPLAFVLSNLNVVKGELARMPELPGFDVPDLRDAVTEALEGAERMRHIVAGLKPFSRVDEHRRGQVDVARIVQASLNMAKNELRHRAKLVTELRPVAPVFANEARLSQVFLNLLMNAAQAMAEGPAGGQLVTVTCRQEGEWVLVSVSDTGSGIAPEVLPRIFDPFFSTKAIGKGTGLGLFISQGIIKDAGGAISVTSALGRGTTFEVRLPAAAAPTTSATSTPLPSRSRARLLLVDDEPAILRSLERLLGKAHDVTLAHSGREALALITAGLEYDLILCDLMMPELSGIDVWEQLTPALRERFVFITGGTFTERAERFLNEVKPPLIEKPFTATTLEGLLRRTQTR